MSVEKRSIEISAPPSEATDDETFDRSSQLSAPLRASNRIDDEPADDFNPDDDYRALSTPAVAALVLGLLSGFALFDWWLGLIPLAGLLMGFLALRSIRKQSNELTGRALAIVGIVLSAGFWIGGASWLGYVQATECPAGYAPVSYSTLQPLPDEPPDRVPPDAKLLDGKKVFIKGYVYPGQKQDGITQFLLVRDQGTCCFGGNPKLTDRILVRLSDHQGLTFSSRLFKLAGVFRVTEPTRAVDARGTVFYHLDEAMLR
jgi:hypothetical protein